MKKVFANWKMSLSALLLVGGLMFVSNTATAQLTSTLTASADIKGVTGTWALESAALQLLLDEINGPIATALEQLPVNSSQFTVWKYKGLLYEQVYNSIQQGVGVSKAVRINYEHLAGASNIEPVLTPLSPAEWQIILNELVDLLTD
ncbi:MAG: hypothetical protein Q7T20_14675 [Saprospiraceae bacterium]|nr:hypothetical protein [Saprospiraceae bacterium]